MDRNKILRIVDANLNRAREGMRTLEEIFRLGRDDPGPAARIKRMRHLLEGFEEALGLRPGELAASRDADGDVGRCAPAGPYSDVEELARGNAKRVEEALRVLEEFSRLAGADPEPVARSRFEAYSLEKELLSRSRRRSRLDAARLYVVLNGSEGDPDPLSTGAAALRGGADILQIRAFAGHDRALIDLARALAEECRESGALLIVNDRADVAAAAGADGVHVGEEDLPGEHARNIVGYDRLVGFSFHPPDGLPTPPQADYIGIGAVFASPLKPKMRPIGPEEAAARFRESKVPAFPIGGINAGNIGELVSRGVYRAAVSSAVAGAGDPEAAARTLKEALEGAAPGS